MLVFDWFSSEHNHSRPCVVQSSLSVTHFSLSNYSNPQSPSSYDLYHINFTVPIIMIIIIMIIIIMIIIIIIIIKGNSLTGLLAMRHDMLKDTVNYKQT